MAFRVVAVQVFLLCHPLELGTIIQPLLSVLAARPWKQFPAWSISKDRNFPEVKASNIFQNPSLPFLQDSHTLLFSAQAWSVEFQVAPLSGFPNSVVENLLWWVYDYQALLLERDWKFLPVVGMGQCLLDPLGLLFQLPLACWLFHPVWNSLNFLVKKPKVCRGSELLLQHPQCFFQK